MSTTEKEKVGTVIRNDSTSADGRTLATTLELPGLPGIVWKLHDTRQLDQAGDLYEVRAVLRPESVNGEPVKYGDAVKIGRAERRNVEIEIWVGDRHYDNPDTITARPRTRIYDESLTGSQSDLLIKAFAAIAHTISIPPLTDGEIRARFVKRAKSVADAARTNRVLDTPYYRTDIHDRVRAALRPQDRETALAVAVIAFTENMRKELAR